MKNLIFTVIVVLVTLASSSSWAYVNVRGYIRSNGTYVAPHIRSNPDGNPYNNLNSFNFNAADIAPKNVFNPSVVAINNPV